MPQWYELLSQMRNTLGLTQADLAMRSHVSLASVKAYEQGKRNPSRPYLIALLDAMTLDRVHRNPILIAAGFSTDWTDKSPSDAEEWWSFTPDEAAKEIEKYSWPAFAHNERAEVFAVNSACRALWDIDLEGDYPDPVSRNLLSVAGQPRFADRVVNWDDAMVEIVKTFKNDHRGASSPEDPSPYFAAVLQRFAEGDPTYVARFAEVWQRAPAENDRRYRWSYKVVWEDPDYGLMRFHGFSSHASEVNGLGFNDWIPLDDESWRAVDQIKAARPHRRSPPELRPQP